MTTKTKALTALILGAFAVPLVLIGTSQASDHADTPDLVKNPGADLTDVYIFPSPEDSSKVVLVMNANPLIGPGQAGSKSFDPNVLYQLKVDTNGDAIEDQVLQFKFSGTGSDQRVSVVGPLKPSMTGTTSRLEKAHATTGKINQTFSPTTNMRVFAGGREDPFFFDLEQFFNILPDRATPINGKPVENPNAPQETSWRPKGEAKDFLSSNNFNVLSIVVELPRTMLAK